MPSQKKRPVTLSSADREFLERLTTTGVHPASMIRRARVLLALDTSVGVVEEKKVIAARLAVSGETVRLVAKPARTWRPRSGASSATCHRCRRRSPGRSRPG